MKDFEKEIKKIENEAENIMTEMIMLYDEGEIKSGDLNFLLNKIKKISEGMNEVAEAYEKYMKTQEFINRRKERLKEMNNGA